MVTKKKKKCDKNTNVISERDYIKGVYYCDFVMMNFHSFLKKDLRKRPGQMCLFTKNSPN
jgi:hypothetical protein